LLIPLTCTFGTLGFDGLPRFFLLASPFVDISCIVSFDTATLLVDGVASPVFGGRPRPRFGVSKLILAFVGPVDFGGRPRPFFALALADDDGLLSPSSK